MTLLSWLPAAVATGLVLNGLRLRSRLAALPTIPPPSRAPLPVDGHEFLVAERVGLGDGTRRAAIEHARRDGVEVLDLIPNDLPVRRALDLASSVKRDAYRADPIGLGRGAGHATLATTGVLDRAEVASGVLDPGTYGEVTRRLKQYARTADLAVVPGPAAPGPGGRRGWLRGLGLSPEMAIAASVICYAAVLVSAAVNPAWGVAALAAYCGVPYVVFAGGPITPRDLHRAAWLRLVDTPLSWWRTLRAPRTRWERRRAEQERAARDWYRAEIAKGVDRFLERRRADCPWCGSTELRRHVVSGDIIQCKPGRFTLERCADCGHVFQNPRLTVDGLNFYYRDVYDGLGTKLFELAFAFQGASYRGRAELIRSHLAQPAARPCTWLDVGTGHGHFCRSAREVLPQVVFDGVDLGAGVEEAQRRGWLRRGYRGLFPRMVDDLAGRYDVVSMHHYLEHTLDPFSELDAAAKVLGPGGHLLIELPNPESLFGRLLGRLWMPWLPPQHLHMIPIGNLKRALTARGMVIVAEELGPAHQKNDLCFAVVVALHTFGPRPDRPWAPAPPRARDRLRQAIALPLAVLLMPPAFVLDQLVSPFVRSRGSAYRVLARKAAG